MESLEDWIYEHPLAALVVFMALWGLFCYIFPVWETVEVLICYS